MTGILCIKVVHGLSLWYELYISLWNLSQMHSFMLMWKIPECLKVMTVQGVFPACQDTRWTGRHLSHDWIAGNQVLFVLIFFSLLSQLGLLLSIFLVLQLMIIRRQNRNLHCQCKFSDWEVSLSQRPYCLWRARLAVSIIHYRRGSKSQNPEVSCIWRDRLEKDGTKKKKKKKKKKRTKIWSPRKSLYPSWNWMIFDTLISFRVFFKMQIKIFQIFPVIKESANRIGPCQQEKRRGQIFTQMTMS